MVAQASMAPLVRPVAVLLAAAAVAAALTKIGDPPQPAHDSRITAD
jgi:archaellum component FlaG (FlaF/FlaG flagellin family)